MLESHVIDEFERTVEHEIHVTSHDFQIFATPHGSRDQKLEKGRMVGVKSTDSDCTR
ncbi:hypothetical protein D3C84_1239040 [compost metagenome]